MLDWQLCKICYPLEMKLLLTDFLFLFYFIFFFYLFIYLFFAGVWINKAWKETDET